MASPSAPHPPAGDPFEELVDALHTSIAGIEGAPSRDEVAGLCDLLYASSLLKEEGRAVRARITIAPPSAFRPEDGPPEGVHALRFQRPHTLSSNEIKRLSPAASFHHSVIAVWPDGDHGLRIWGLLNTGPRWRNLVAGGRKPIGSALAHPLIHVRDPGWLLFYSGYDLISEWRGRDFSSQRLDVFQSTILSERFRQLRWNMVADSDTAAFPQALTVEAYSELAHQVAVHFVKRVITLVRTSGHGGSLIFVPEGPAGGDLLARWIDCKYSTSNDAADSRFRRLLYSIVRRIGQLCEPDDGLAEALVVFRTSEDAELDRLEEAFFELARLYSDMMQVDGALVVDFRLSLLGFGGEIRVDRNVLQVDQAHDLAGVHRSAWNVLADGTRHRSVYRLCSVESAVIGFVISQDSQVRMILNIDENVVFWSHTMI